MSRVSRPRGSQTGQYGRRKPSAPGPIHGTWIEKVARIGFIAKGAVYVVVGVLAAKAAFGAGGDLTGSEGAMATILRQDFGRVLLGLLAFGLAAYSFWRFVEAIKNPRRHDQDLKGWTQRAYMFVSGLLHANLVLIALRLMGFTSGAGGSTGGSEGAVAQLMSQPYGRWLVYGLAAIVLCFAARQIYRAWTKSFRRHLDFSSVSHDTRRWLTRSAQWALVARGIVFGTVGVLIFAGANNVDPQQAAGLGEAMRTLETQPFGPWLLGFVAIGLGLYGVYQFTKAYFKVVPVPA